MTRFLTCPLLEPVPEGLQARFDPDRLTRVLGAEAAGGTLRLRVRDHGPGLPAGERLFERFYRADPARTRRTGGGSGLGLAIARALAEAHGGQLTAGNHSEGGAVFTVALPGAVG